MLSVGSRGAGAGLHTRKVAAVLRANDVSNTQRCKLRGDAAIEHRIQRMIQRDAGFGSGTCSRYAIFVFDFARGRRKVDLSTLSHVDSATLV